MTTTIRTNTIDAIGAFFEKEGRIYTAREYQKLNNPPVRMAQIKRLFGSWGRLETILRKSDSRNFKDAIPDTNIEEVLKARFAVPEAEPVAAPEEVELEKTSVKPAPAPKVTPKVEPKK